MVSIELSIVPTVIELCDAKMRPVSGGMYCNSCGKAVCRGHDKLPLSSSAGKLVHLLVYVQLF